MDLAMTIGLIGIEPRTCMYACCCYCCSTVAAISSILKGLGTDAGPTSKSVVRKESQAAGQVVNQKYTEDSRTITVVPGQAFAGDNRSSSGNGLGDGLTSHTAKWLQVSDVCNLM